MTDIWIAVTNDRHTDIEVAPFSNPEMAISFARNEVEANARHPEDRGEWDTELNPAMIEDGWVFYTLYSTEGDCVWVVKRTLDEP